jgi:hypothetical protein
MRRSVTFLVFLWALFLCSVPDVSGKVNRDGDSDTIKVCDEFRISIDTPDLKAQRRSKLVLKNGIKVLLISDPGIVKSGAALSVETGYWRDPPGISGLGISLDLMN